MPFDSLRPKVSTILANENESVDQRLTEICELLQASIGYYDWVGFYFANEETRTLHLRAFAGEPTEHTVIPFGKGICGQVAESNENFVVADVKAQNNYIACNMYVKAEIVIPLFKDGKNIGQIDIDSHMADPFSSEDERFLEWVNQEVADIL
ncbi:MAG: GAF domain-containing protein [Flavobacteriales bacterium]|jgi:L-methionine (R)-S-oxide reductase|uniref:GAF domain-containing protein n=1 Tax=Candidatus Ulvibacter alkanivorans TaxID=2267620 RepID=UPI000DF3EB56|nr:GAF domain-containing protein [Candidatus Ulvibacter alkanivorans]MCH2489318.1 GAF domain-containing protein [Flavobacteriales bacterium]